jgi:oligopeptide/dipeptide ABC transporter ATP-binding protein
VSNLEVMQPDPPPDVPPNAVLSVRDLRVEFDTDDGVVTAVDGLSFDIRENEVLAVVGESGSGKSVTAMAIMGLLPRTARVTGDVWFRGEPILGLGDRELCQIRGRRIAMVFQDALTALNPVYTVAAQIAEAMTVHNKLSDRDVDRRVEELLGLVGIPNPRQRMKQYPHEFSGGMRQRAMIAMAIANDPDVLIADEPTTALDVTIQAQVLDVLERVQRETRSAIALITHDLGVVAGVANRVMVMYAGRAVEVGNVDDLFYQPRHPYTLGLLASLPRVDVEARDRRLFRIKGQPPSLLHVPPGCAFHPRCDYARVPEPCAVDTPALRDVGPLHRSACHFAEELANESVAALQERSSAEGERA